MAKKENVQEAGKSAAGKKGSETPADDNQESTTIEIQTVEDLEACYPDLVSEIRDEVIEQIQKKSGPNLNVPGFLLEVDDPVAAGTLRAYRKLKGLSDLRLPYVLPFKDKATKAALDNYILRAEGSGNYERAEAAQKAMEKIK